MRHREKRLAKQKEYDAARREEKLAYNKAWAAEHRSLLREYHKAYRASDKPGALRMRSMGSEYQRRHREGNEAYSEANRARQAVRRAKGAQIEIVTISEALFDHDTLCHLCGGPIRSASEAELDHIIPLKAGGEHTRDNLAPAHARCNRIKRGLHPDHIPPHIIRKFHAELHTHFIAPPNWPMSD